jgi:hypothetical protein
MVRFAIILPALALSACVQLADITDSKPQPLTAQQRAQIEQTVTRDFFDPASAQFRDVRMVTVTLANGSQETRVCGEVNGKNRMGGYTGFSMFGGVMTSTGFERRDFFSACEPW